MSNVIQVPVMLEGKEFYEDRTDKALRALETDKDGYEAVYMPLLIDARIRAPESAKIWRDWYTAPSIRATGRTRQGNPVVLYAHIPNYFSKAANITKAIEEGLINDAGILPVKPKNEFQRLLDLEDGENVSVLDYELAMKWPFGYYGIDGPTDEHMQKYDGKIDGVEMIAINNPHAIAFLTKNRAEAYLKRHKEVYGDKIGVRRSEDLHEHPLARLLFLGVHGYLDGGSSLNYDGRFVGVPKKSAKGAARKTWPKEQVLRIVGEYVILSHIPDLEQRIRAL